MSSSVSPIGVNSQGIGNAYGFGLRPKTGEKGAQKTEVNQQPQPQQSSVSANDVLSHMAQSATLSPQVASTKSLNPANYVDSQSAQRIGSSMAKFEGMVKDNLEMVSKEFPSISESMAYAIAASMIEDKVS